MTLTTRTAATRGLGAVGVPLLGAKGVLIPFVGDRLVPSAGIDGRQGAATAAAG